MTRLRRFVLTAAVFVSSMLAAACGRFDHRASRKHLTDAGVSRELAKQRARTLSDVEYQVLFRVPSSLGEPVTGRVEITFALGERPSPVVLDFDAPRNNLLSVRLRGAPGEAVDYAFLNGHIVLPRSAVHRGENHLEVEFVAADDPLNRNGDFLYTLFVPDRAHRAFPCFDQPDLKARFRLTLVVPEGWKAVANGPEEDVVNGAAPVDGEALTTYHFAETPPIPTYLFSFAAGAFQVERAERDGRRMRMFHRETDSLKVARNREAIFDLQGKALAWLEDYTGIPYPFDKFDFVLIPSFQYGGMEHPGAILYRAASLFLDETATQNQELGRASVISHETAHMWFGDLVTMRWFDDVWMKEVFANFMAAKIVNPSFPDIDHDLRFLLAHYPAAYGVDRTAGANPIRQKLENLREAGSLYGAIIYQKAPIVMRQLELLVGAQEMREGLREYLRAHAFGNASWPDLVEVLDRLSPQDLREWSHVWVEEAGRPTVTLSEARSPDSGQEAGLMVVESDPRGRGLSWVERVELLAGYPDTVLHFPLRLQGGGVPVPLPAGPPPTYLLANGGGWGYGLFRLTPDTRRYLLEHFPDLGGERAGSTASEAGETGGSLGDPIPRGVAWLSLWDEMLDGAVKPRALLRVGMRALWREPEELLVDRILSDVSTAYWRFLSPEERREIAPGLEELLWERVASARHTSLKASFFRAFRSVALTPASVERLVSLWSGTASIAGLPLSERDRTTLAAQLALRQVDGWERILSEQRESIRNPDRRARFAFVMPALSAEPSIRDSFFETLRDPKNRAREPWVLEGLSYLHHPLRAAPSRHLIQPSLEMLEEIQRTGDIFFPKRWLDATLGGHSSPAAAEIVREFLAEHPELPARLREKVLQSADLLFRAAAGFVDSELH